VRRSRSATDFEGFLSTASRRSTVLRTLPVPLEGPEIDAESKKKVGQDWLEAHARVYVIDHFLAALNWNLRPADDPQEYLDMAPEIGVRSEARDTRRFLDYFGFEYRGEHVVPLLVVEAKRPSCGIPMQGCGASPLEHPLARAVVDHYRKGSGATFAPLAKEWQDYLDDLADYVRSVHENLGSAPKKVAMANGEWLIVFRRPQATFVDNTGDPTDVLVYESLEQVLQSARTVYTELDYYALASPRERKFEPPELVGHVPAGQPLDASYGLVVLRVCDPRPYEVVPRLSVSPIMVLFSRDSVPLFVHRPLHENQFDLRGSDDHGWHDLPSHLREVSDAANQLKTQVETKTQAVLRLLPLGSLFDSERATLLRVSQRMPVVEQVRYELLTGDMTHFLRTGDSHDTCPSHATNTTAVADRVLPRDGEPCFFPDATPGHCCRRDMYLAKGKALSSEMIGRLRLGRSGGKGESFCETWGVDHFLCCRSCVYCEACVATGEFSLECPQH